MEDRLPAGLPRTNKSVEAWHGAFQASLQCAHPTVWKLIHSLITVQSIGGSQTVHKKAHYKRVNAALTTLLNRRNEMPLLDFFAWLCIQPSNEQIKVAYRYLLYI